MMFRRRRPRNWQWPLRPSGRLRRMPGGRPSQCRCLSRYNLFCSVATSGISPHYGLLELSVVCLAIRLVFRLTRMQQKAAEEAQRLAAEATSLPTQHTPPVPQLWVHDCCFHPHMSAGSGGSSDTARSEGCEKAKHANYLQVQNLFVDEDVISETMAMIQSGSYCKQLLLPELNEQVSLMLKELRRCCQLPYLPSARAPAHTRACAYGWLAVAG